MYDERYSAYFNMPDESYPAGSAVDSTNEDRLDGTPYLAAFFNDVIGFLQAVFYGVFGNPMKGEPVLREPSGEPESAKRSDVWDAIKKHISDGDDSVREYTTEKTNAAIEYVEEKANESKEYVEEKTDEAKEQIDKALAEIENFVATYCPYPVGATYVQFPSQKSPGTLWKGTSWEPLSYGGAFFRAEGGRAGSFAAEGNTPTLQRGAIQSHYHDVPAKTASGKTGKMNQNQSHSHIFFANEEGANPIVNNGDGTVSGFLSFAHGGDELSLSQSHSWNINNCVAGANTDHDHDFSVTVPRHYTDDFGIEETRPDNYTYRIWVRVA